MIESRKATLRRRLASSALRLVVSNQHPRANEHAVTLIDVAVDMWLFWPRVFAEMMR